MRRLFRDFFDVHATGARGDQHRPGRLPIDHHAQIQLAGNVAAFFHEHLPNDLPFGPGLNRHQRLAQQIAGDFGGFVGRFHQLHAVLLRSFDRAFAAAAGVNLRFHHGDRSAQIAKRLGRFLRRARHEALGHRDARFSQNCLGLKFVNFHDAAAMNC